MGYYFYSYTSRTMRNTRIKSYFIRSSTPKKNRSSSGSDLYDRKTDRFTFYYKTRAITVMLFITSPHTNMKILKRLKKK